MSVPYEEAKKLCKDVETNFHDITCNALVLLFAISSFFLYIKVIYLVLTNKNSKIYQSSFYKLFSLQAVLVRECLHCEQF